MDDIIEFVIELLGELLETALGSIKNPQIRKWALTVFYSLITVAVCGFLAWIAITLYLEQNMTGALSVAGVAGVLFLVFGFFILRRHKKRNWKNKHKD